MAFTRMVRLELLMLHGNGDREIPDRALQDLVALQLHIYTIDLTTDVITDVITHGHSLASHHH
ncbi:hypothetical protein I79_015714 [Cricetulus griseus]|uniref:Uncharacterized protein n=1 Tax=Cricetulus griseus TaxID=10029 RepID=G3HXJ1_CRIGR|nr:hypothetical protein I79_015714 [Cricetulus griseus]